jgi:hypothetical protein
MTIRRELGKRRLLARLGRAGVKQSHIARRDQRAERARDRRVLEQYGEGLSGEPAGR